MLMYESLRAGRLDMAVLYNPPLSPDLEMTLLHEESLILIGGRKKNADSTPLLKPRMPLSALADLPLIAPSRPNAFRILIEAEMARIQCKPKIVLEIDGLNAILEVVKEGLGYAVLPSYTLSNFNNPKDFSVHAIEKPQLLSQLMLVWSARRPQTPTHKASLQLAQDMVSSAIKSQAMPSA